ncbi:MAG: YfhO family protein [Oscillospiraceae bacterium]|nr:YfhO family protein [Oscillospiraceae bacterium]
MEETARTSAPAETAKPAKKKAGIPEWVEKLLPYLLPPLAVMALMLVNFYANKLYPFGEGTVAWCDMTQQVVPLLCDFKDILTGKDGLFLNFDNAGGMNMWAVVFFFVSSPLSVLVLFVDKMDMIYFVNILCILKLMLCSLTAVVYFRRRVPALDAVWGGIFSVAYALSGYAMLYYQNNIWLDMMYLFPLLMTAFGEMLDHRRLWPYVAVLTAMMIVNYYIGYMIVLYVLLFMGLFCFMYWKDKKYTYAAVDFVTGSLLAALLSAAVWLPSFIQYLGSGRKGSFFEPFENSGFFARYQTTLPTLMHAVLVLVIFLVCIMDGKRREKRVNFYLFLLPLLCIPLYVEPLNLMWHTGSYMAFPSRYGFIPQFVMIAATAMMFSDAKHRPVKELKGKLMPLFALLMVCSTALFFVTRFMFAFVKDNRDAVSAYVGGLWGNDRSFHMIIKMMFFLGGTYLLYYMLFRKGRLTREVFTMLCALLLAVEGYCNLDIYMSSAHYKEPERAVDQRMVMDLGDRIEDEDFYRVRTSSKLFDINLVGAMGYNSISHYTSLTSFDYMDMMKRMGYSSYWMEVGSYGGTELTDALFCMKYNIRAGEPHRDTVYYNNKYSIDPIGYSLPLGIVTHASGDLNISEMERCEVQQYIYENTIGNPGDQLVVRCEAENADEIEKLEDRYYLEEGTELHYTVDVTGKQSLYFDCFDKVSNSIKEEINDSFSITVNGNCVNGCYPSSGENGLLRLGVFENETVEVDVKCLRDCDCASFGVFLMDLDMLYSSTPQAADFNQKAGKLTGTVQASAGDRLILSIPYSESLKVRVNGKTVTPARVFDDMLCIDLAEGNNTITVTGTAKGFVPGLLITLAGIVLCVVCKRCRRKLTIPAEVQKVAFLLAILLGVLTILFVYVMPLAVNMRVVTGI